MTMRATTVRFSEDLWERIESEAERQGVSAAQLIRDATILRVGALGAAGESRATAGDGGEPRLADPAVIGDSRRLEALAATGLMDSGPEASFERITRLASGILDAPVALVSLVGEDRQYFKSCLGLSGRWAEARQTPLTHSFCQHAVESRVPLIVRDARQHPLLKDNLAIPDLGVVAYAGIPLVTSRGLVLGTLCVIDDHPRDWTAEQINLLTDLAATVTEQIEDDG